MRHESKARANLTESLKKLKMIKLEGIIAAPLTAFKADGSVDCDVVPAYARLLKANGVAGAFVNGTTGEGMSLTVEDRAALAKAWCAHAADDFRIIIHVGHVCQEESKAMARHAAESGAHAIGEMAPCFFRPADVESLVAYCRDTAAACDLPYFFYHMPSMANVDFPMIEFLKAADGSISTLAGIKYTHEDLADYAECVAYGQGRFSILFGRDELLTDGLKAGMQGAVGSTYNVMAPLYVKLIAAYRAGQLAEADRLQALAIEGIGIMARSGSFGSAMKAVMQDCGLPLGGGVMLPPQKTLDADSQRQVVAQFESSELSTYMCRSDKEAS